MSALALKGPYWVTVRQYRRTLWVAGALALLALAVVGGLRIWDGQTPDRVLPDGSHWPADESRGYETLRIAMDYAGMGAILLPLFVGAFVAGPLIAREFESGTYRLSLAQSVSPAAWLRAKVLTATVAATVLTLALMGVFRIGWSRVSGTYQLSWADRGPYEATGTVLLAYVLAAVAVGTLVGLLVRRTLLAMSATGLVMGAVVFVLGSLRWSFLPVRTITGPAVENASTVTVPGDGLIVEQGLISTSGQRLSGWFCNPGQPTHGDCRPDVPIAGQYVDYHPYSHYWPTQLVETGILLALAALAAFAAFRVLRARLP